MAINGSNYPLFNQAGRYGPDESRLILKPPNPRNPKVMDADFVVVAGEVADEQDSNNRRMQQPFNQSRFGNSGNNKNAENVYVARMEMRNPQQIPPVKALAEQVGELQQQVLEMQGQLASLLGPKPGLNRDLQRPNVLPDPRGHRQIDVA